MGYYPLKSARIKRVLVAALSLLATSWQSVASAEEAPNQVEMAKTFVAQMANGQFEKAVKPFDQTMSQALPGEKIKQIWNGIIKENGLFQRVTETRTEKYPQYNMVYVTCEFQQGTLDAKVVFTSGNKIAGLFFLPWANTSRRAYADFSKFEEKEIQIGKGIWSLPGTLSLPQGDGPFPAVILVQAPARGSG